MKYLISIISEQTLPNYLLIKEFKGKIDKYVFISTKRMEELGKSKIIYDTIGIEKSNRVKTNIEEDALYLAKEKLDRLNFPHDAEYLVNLTGGTKLMSIAIREYFKKFENVRFFYIPIGKNIYKELFDDKPAKENEFKYKITLEEYLKIYGIDYETQPLLFSEEQVDDIYRDVYSTHFDLEHFPKKKLKHLGITDYIVMQVHTKWFEEYIYYKIKKILQLDDRFIATGIKLKDSNLAEEIEYYQNDNELDVFFIYNNNPFIIELKFSIGRKKINTAALNNTLFKLSAINRRFGLRSKSTVMTLADFNQMGENARQYLQAKCKILKITYPFDRNIIINEELFEEKLINFIK